jgi:aspartyl-tRNA(Asn)/glutamyl-tRNA(Gln) amidotransferase subunit B
MAEPSKYETFIGLEIHIQLLTKSKVFCGCANNYGDEPNSNVCPICMGYPGVLPVLNRQALFMAYQVASALKCQLAEKAAFERKNYFYPDMPKNYQISQFAEPVGIEGSITFPYAGSEKQVRIHDVHLEEDAGKMIHAGDISLLDYNRAGTPLLEIVTEPDLKSGDETEAFLRYFRNLVRTLRVCRGNMEEGNLRCDANISINLPGKGLGTKVELKNMNSSRFVRLALDYEEGRQGKLLDEGQMVDQETRLWNENKDVTVIMRRKEESKDYRYFPEPDLPPYRPDAAFFASVEESLPELPLERVERLSTEYRLEQEHSFWICEERERADYFETAVKAGADTVQLFSWMNGDLAALVNRKGRELSESHLSPEKLAQVLALLEQGVIQGPIAKKLVAALYEEDRDPQQLIEEQGWKALGDSRELQPVVTAIMEKHPEAAKQLASGEKKVLGFFMGQVMKETGGRAEPEAARKMIEEMVSKL